MILTKLITLSLEGTDPVTIGLHLGIAKRACKIWISWRWGIKDALIRTAAYVQLDEGFDQALLTRWEAMVAPCEEEWATMIGLANERVDDADEDDEWEAYDLEALVEY